jgi:hypothetical protein
MSATTATVAAALPPAVLPKTAIAPVLALTLGSASLTALPVWPATALMALPLVRRKLLRPTAFVRSRLRRAA